MKIFKKLSILIVSAMLLFFAGCNSSSDQPKIIKNDDGTISITRVEEDGKAIQFNKKYKGSEGVTIIDIKKCTKNNPVYVDLSEYTNISMFLEFNCDMLVENATGEKTQITWMVNEINAGLPQIFNEKVPSGEWTHVSGDLFLVLGEKRQLYISGANLDKENTKIYLKNFNVKLAGEGIGEQKMEVVNWLDAPSLKDAYKDYFDYFGIATTFNDELSKSKFREGLVRHADSITMGNEFKPDFIFAWARPTSFVDYTGEDGKIYKVPENPPKFTTVDRVLQICKDNNLKMRGHVLVWHNQTPDWFFYKDWGNNGEDDYVSISEMNARMEWYIQTVLNHIKKWEEDNNNDERIITTWDVVNEAVSDNATEASWVRPADSSNWTAIYGDETYIINAFRYANKYAPKEVKLAYNDYNCYGPQKRKAICTLIDKIQATPDARIDILGMQSHVKIDYPPITGANSYEEAVQMFTKKGVDVQVTELDIANGSSPNNDIRLKKVYKDYFEMFINNRKTTDKNGIEGVTIWGSNDEGTWLNALKEYQGHTQYPLLFRNNYTCKPAFYGVLEAAQQE